MVVLWGKLLLLNSPAHKHASPFLCYRPQPPNPASITLPLPSLSTQSAPPPLFHGGTGCIPYVHDTFYSCKLISLLIFNPGLFFLLPQLFFPLMLSIPSSESKTLFSLFSCPLLYHSESTFFSKTCLFFILSLPLLSLKSS